MPVRATLGEGGWGHRANECWGWLEFHWSRLAGLVEPGLVSKGFDHERNSRGGCSQSGIAG